MDSSDTPLSFPTLAEEKPSPQPTANPSPTFNAAWLPQLSTTSVQPRNNLRPLDLASSVPVSKPQQSSPTTPKHSAKSISTKTFPSPRRQMPLMTPPLTPSSSFASSAGNDTDGESGLLLTPPSEPASPCPVRWGLDVPAFRNPSIVERVSTDNLAANFASLRIPSHDDETPKVEKTLRLDFPARPHDFDAIQPKVDLIFSRNEPAPTTFIAVRPIPSAISSESALPVIQAATRSPIQAMIARFHLTHEVAFFNYTTTSDAIAAITSLNGQTVGTLFSGLCNKDGSPITDDRNLEAICVSSDEINSISDLQSRPFKAIPGYFVSIEKNVVQATELQAILASFGRLKSFQATDDASGSQIFHVEYDDPRDQESAYGALDGKPIRGALLKFSINPPTCQSKAETHVSLPLLTFPSLSSNPNGEVDISSPKKAAHSLGVEVDSKYHTTKVNYTNRGSFAAPLAPLRPMDPHEGSRSHQSFGGLEKPLTGPHPSYPGGGLPFGSDSRDILGLSPMTPAPYTYPDHYAYDFNAPYYHSSVQTVQPGVNGFAAMSVCPPFSPIPWDGPTSPTLAFPNLQPIVPTTPTHASLSFPHVGPRRLLDTRRPNSRSLGSPFNPSFDQGPAGNLHSHPAGSLRDGHETTKKGNELDVERIEAGLDTRTTVMIKNIPNKMTDKDLLNFIGRVCPRRIDFMYLRMDFQNGCNVGYAFVNFITVQDLLYFAKTQLGVKWNMYSSEKVLHMNYATYQGKESLVEKFKNSCIMDEREAWRPKIFYSDGPSQGLSEPFPPPTHLRRKERSAHNRGALYTPGPHYLHSHGASRRYDDRQRDRV